MRVKSTVAVGSSLRAARTTTAPGLPPKTRPVWARPAVSVRLMGEARVALPETMVQVMPTPGLALPLSRASMSSGLARVLPVGPVWPSPLIRASVRTRVAVRVNCALTSG